MDESCVLDKPTVHYFIMVADPLQTCHFYRPLHCSILVVPYKPATSTSKCQDRSSRSETMSAIRTAQQTEYFQPAHASLQPGCSRELVTDLVTEQLMTRSATRIEYWTDGFINSLDSSSSSSSSSSSVNSECRSSS